MPGGGEDSHGLAGMRDTGLSIRFLLSGTMKALSHFMLAGLVNSNTDRNQLCHQ